MRFRVHLVVLYWPILCCVVWNVFFSFFRIYFQNCNQLWCATYPKVHCNRCISEFPGFLLDKIGKLVNVFFWLVLGKSVLFCIYTKLFSILAQNLSAFSLYFVWVPLDSLLIRSTLYWIKSLTPTVSRVQK